MKRFTQLGIGLLFAALPSTSTYTLNNYGFGSGGTAGSSTATYSLEGSSGDFAGATGSTSTYTTKSGLIQTQEVNAPMISVLDNSSGQYYNKLHFVLDTQNNASDAKYLITVIAAASFTGDSGSFQQDGPLYLHPDGTVSSTINAATDYQTYAALGGSSGSLIIGLTPSTTYSVRVRAIQGKFSESSYGPAATTPTAAPSLTFSLVTSTQNSPPYSVDFGSLTAGSVYTSSNSINTVLSTNGTSGGNVYIRAQNGSLLSGSTGNHIDAVSTDLSSASRGFGAQNSSITQSSGGPYSVDTTYNVSGPSVGILSTITRSLYTSAKPVTNGTGVLLLKAKASSTDVAATDYTEVLTFIAAGNF